MFNPSLKEKVLPNPKGKILINPRIYKVDFIEKKPCLKKVVSINLSLRKSFHY